MLRLAPVRTSRTGARPPNTTPPPRRAGYAQRLQWRGTRKPSPGLHARRLAGISLSGVCVTAVESRPAGVLWTSPARGHRPFGARVKAFVALTKPRIIELLLITTVPVMFLAAAGRARPVAGARHLPRRLSVRGRRQRAQHVHRPRHRRADGPYLAAPAGHRHGQPARVPGLRHRPRGGLHALVRPARQLAVGRARRSARSSSTSSSTRCCSSAVPRRTSSGAASPAACRCSSAGPPSRTRCPGPPVILFLVIFFWTPPHYWPLSMKVKDDYARVGVPMLPVVASNKVVARQIVLYSWVMVGGLAAAHPAGLHRLVLHRRSRCWRAASGCGRRTALQNRAKAGVTGAQAQGDAAVPLVHHLCVAALRGRRGGPLPALVTRSCSTGGARGTSHVPARRQFDLPVGSILSMAETAETQQADDAAGGRAERKAAKLAKQIGAFAKAARRRRGPARVHRPGAAPASSSSARTAAGATWWPRPTPSPRAPRRRPGSRARGVRRRVRRARSARARTSGRGWPGSRSAARPTTAERPYDEGAAGLCPPPLRRTAVQRA